MSQVQNLAIISGQGFQTVGMASLRILGRISSWDSRTVDVTGPELGDYHWAGIPDTVGMAGLRIWFTWHNVIKSWKLEHNSTYLSTNVVQS